MARFEPVFATRESALAAKDALLARFPWAMVVIRDAESPQSAVEYIDQAGYGRFADARDAWRRWHSMFPPLQLFLRLFRRPPPDPWGR